MKQQSIKIILTLFFFYILPDLFSQPLPPTPPPQPKSVDVIFNDGSSTTANEVNVCSSQFVQFNVNGDAYNKSKNYALWYELDEGPWFFNSDDNCPGCNSGPDKTTFLAKGKTYTTKADRNKIIMVVYAVDTNGMTIIGLCRWVHIKLIYKPDNISAILGLDSVCRLSNNLEYSVSPVDSATGYKWVLPQGFSGAGITNNINVNITGQALPGYIYVNAYNQCGNSPQSKLFINVDSLPPKPVKPIGSKSLCINNPNTTYRTIPLANAAFYEWKLKPDSAGEIIANPNLKNDFISVDWNNEFTGTASIEVRASNYCGTSPFSDSLVINIHPLPDSASNIFGIDKPCINSNDIPFYTEAINHSNNYVWTLPDGATGTSNSQTILISFTAQAKAGQISVSGKNNCGTGKAAYKNIEIDYPATKADKPSGNNF
ncbi:MAG: hypothetical protein KA792_09445, partial [Bacteroidales bacterium]|nr:hypothetical protein [Bacteroidales bacterium]